VTDWGSETGGDSGGADDGGSGGDPTDPAERQRETSRLVDADAPGDASVAGSGGPTGTSGASGPAGAPTPDDGPLGDLAADVRRRRGSDREGGRDAAASFFDSVGFDPVDVEDVWAHLLGSGDQNGNERGAGAEDGRGSDATAGVDEALGGDATDADAGEDTSAAPDPAGTVDGTADGDGTDRPERVVEKRSFCQRCPHFDSPPAATCGHGTAEIVAVVDFDRFRVRGCPMVAEYGGEDGPGSIPRSDDL